MAWCNGAEHRQPAPSFQMALSTAHCMLPSQALDDHAAACGLGYCLSRHEQHAAVAASSKTALHIQTNSPLLLGHCRLHDFDKAHVGLPGQVLPVRPGWLLLHRLCCCTTTAQRWRRCAVASCTVASLWECDQPNCCCPAPMLLLLLLCCHASSYLGSVISSSSKSSCNSGSTSTCTRLGQEGQDRGGC